MLSGWKTFIAGLGLAIGPQVVSFLSGFDFVKTFGLSPNAASVLGVGMIVLRAVTTSPIFSSAKNS